jgi:hypothetical protein
MFVARFRSGRLALGDRDKADHDPG